MADTSLTILVIDENPTRATILEDGLREAGLVDVVRLDTTHELLKRIFEIDPDVILIDLASPSRDVLEQMFQVSRTVKRPVAMFVDQSDSAMIESAVDAGVSAYIVDGLRKERVKSILDMTVSRFNAFDRLTRELQQARDELADRKLVERAKGILMKSRGISEEEAYGMLRRTAMNEKVKLADIARSVVTAAQLLG
ncbi:ANTAR domain-containing response regulator [Pinisolibacter sp.]|uniref:ANTAR domain-containing response regulator n=1 Tax=Pinisolibacter sp. TaxID=2172024 RepID=UPI002FDC8DAF